MYKMIAVDTGLENVIQALRDSGYKTTPLEGQVLDNIQAVVVKGNETVTNLSNVPLKMPVVNASGRSAAEIVDVIRDRLS